MTVADLLRELIRIPSVNPDGDPGTTHTGERECAKFVADFLRSCGAEAWLEDVLPDRPNVLGRFPSAGKAKPRLLFAPHTDTVSVTGIVSTRFPVSCAMAGSGAAEPQIPKGRWRRCSLPCSSARCFATPVSRDLVCGIHGGGGWPAGRQSPLRQRKI